jgi:hypothetical protein
VVAALDRYQAVLQRLHLALRPDLDQRNGASKCSGEIADAHGRRPASDIGKKGRTMRRMCTGCGREVEDAAFCPYCSKPTVERPAAPSAPNPGSSGWLTFFRVLAIILMVLGLVQFLSYLIWYFVSEARPMAGNERGTWILFVLQMSFPPFVTIALGAILAVLVQIAVRLEVLRPGLK